MGYESTGDGPAAETCGASGGAYTLTGCAPIVCTTPAAAATTGFTIVETQVSLAVGFDVTATCQDYYGYTLADGSLDPADLPVVTACTAPGPYIVTGCTLNNPCATEEDDCVDNIDDSSHECIHTGPGTHSCRCLDSAYGSAAAAEADRTLDGQSEACTACPAQDNCLASSNCMGSLPVRTAASLGCSPGRAADGYYVDASATVQQCAVGTYQLAGGVGTEGCPACTSQTGCVTDGTVCLPPTATGDLPLQLECVAVADLYYLVDGVATAIVCTTPADSTGYDVSAESLVLGASIFSVTADCATGYEGIPTAAACSANGGAYTLSGCAAVECTQPLSIAGYTVTNTELSVATGFDVTVACDTGYESTGDGPAATTCGAVSGEYTLSGCSMLCAQPASTAGYTVDELQVLVSDAFSVTATCDTENGYEGTAVATACTAPNTAYTLSGCAPIVCTGLVAGDWPSYVLPSQAYNLDLSAGAFDATVTCADGLSGTAVATACTTSGEPYTVSGCTNQCAQQVGATLKCSSADNCVYTTTVMNEQQLSASVQVSVTGGASFASASASASASGSTTTAQTSTEETSLEHNTCKFYILYISDDYSTSGCAASKDALARTPALDAEGRCPVSAEYTAERPECSASHINDFISECGLLPPPAPPPASSTPAPAGSAAATAWHTASVLRAMACAGVASWLWRGAA